MNVQDRKPSTPDFSCSRSPQEDNGDHVSLPDPGQSTIEAWQKVLQNHQYSQLLEEEKSPEELERIQNAFKVAQTGIEETIKSYLAGSQESSDQTPFDSLVLLAQNIFKGSDQISTAIHEDQDPRAKEIQQDMIDQTTQLFPEFLKSFLQIDPKKILEINAFSPLSAISGLFQDELKPVLKKGIEVSSSIFEKHFHQKLMGENELEESLEGLFTELKKECNFSYASVLGIENPDTLQGRIQKIERESGPRQFEVQKNELALSQDPQVQETAIRVLKESGCALVLQKFDDKDTSELAIGVLEKMKERLTMECVLAGCSSVSELNKKKEKVQELREKLRETTEPLIELQRHYQILVGFAQNEQEKGALKSLFDYFKIDLDAYVTFQKAEQAIYGKLSSVGQLCSEELSSIYEELQNLSINELLESGLKRKIVNKSSNKILESFLELVKPVIDQTNDEMTKQGCLVTTTLIYRMWKSSIRLQQAEDNSPMSSLNISHSLETNHGHIYEMNEAFLYEKDTQVYDLQQLFERRKLDELEWMATFGDKSDKTLLEELAEQENIFHHEYLKIMGSQSEDNTPKIELFDD